MNKIVYVWIVASLFGVFAAFSKENLSENDDSKVYAGLWYGKILGDYWVNASFLPGLAGFSGKIQTENQTTPAYGFLLETALSDKISVSLRTGIFGENAIFRTKEIETFPVQREIVKTFDGEFKTVGTEALFKYSPAPNLGLIMGYRFEALFSGRYNYRVESIYSDGSSSTDLNLSSLNYNEANFFNLYFSLGFSYDIPLVEGGKSVLSPEFRYNVALTSAIENADVKAHNFYIGFSTKVFPELIFGEPKKSEKIETEEKIKIPQKEKKSRSTFFAEASYEKTDSESVDFYRKPQEKGLETSEFDFDVFSNETANPPTPIKTLLVKWSESKVVFPFYDKIIYEQSRADSLLFSTNLKKPFSPAAELKDLYYQIIDVLAKRALALKDKRITIRVASPYPESDAENPAFSNKLISYLETRYGSDFSFIRFEKTPYAKEDENAYGKTLDYYSLKIEASPLDLKKPIINEFKRADLVCPTALIFDFSKSRLKNGDKLAFFVFVGSRTVASKKILNPSEKFKLSLLPIADSLIDQENLVARLVLLDKSDKVLGVLDKKLLITRTKNEEYWIKIKNLPFDFSDRHLSPTTARTLAARENDALAASYAKIICRANEYADDKKNLSLAYARGYAIRRLLKKINPELEIDIKPIAEPKIFRTYDVDPKLSLTRRSADVFLLVEKRKRASLDSESK